MAAGDQGDFLLENSQIRTVISKAGISRAFGLFGGTIVDADRVRANGGLGDSSGGPGFDSLVEMFPLFFLGAVDPEKSEIVNDGKDGKPAIVRITGKGASFVALTEQINNLVIFAGGSNRLHFELSYILRPGVNYIEFHVKVTNQSKSSYAFSDFASKANPNGSIPSATGIVGLFGKRNTVFIPGHAGYNIRFTLESVFKTVLKPPALPGLVGDFIGSRGQNGVNYGIVAKRDKNNYVNKFRQEFKKLGAPYNDGSVLVPLEGSSITACFAKLAPTVLLAGKSFESTLYIVVGDGSVSSIRDAQLEIHGRPKGLVTGQVLEKDTHQPIRNARVIAYTGKGTKPGDRIFYSEFITDRRGFFKGYLEADPNKARKYKLIALNHEIRSQVKEIEVKKDQKSFTLLEIQQPARLNVTVRDQDGRLVPAKIQVVGAVEDFQGGRCVGKEPIGCLYDFHLGDSKLDSDFKVGLRCSDLKTKCMSHGDCKSVPGTDKSCAYRLGPKTEYREKVIHSLNGLANFAVRPGKYHIVASRGMEYEIDRTKDRVELKSGKLTQINLVVKHSVPTPKAISGDLHVHTNYSHDVSISDRSRIASYVAEGVDYFVTTDHNRIRDMQPLVLSYQIERWIKTGIGVELTTFEMGHFNAFPLLLNSNLFNGGNPDWFKKETRYKNNPSFPPSVEKQLKGMREGIPPGELFSALRQRASLCNNKTDCDKVIVQVNHPRDTIFGYFGVFNMGESGLPIYKSGFASPLSREFDVDQFSTAFDAIEIFNGNRFDLLWHWRVPPGMTSIAGYPAVPNSIIRSMDGTNAALAYPGGASDWFSLLNRGMSITGTGNSDSHNHEPEAGYPRNYFWVGFDTPARMNDQRLVKAIKEKKVLMTNGPILEAWLKGDKKDSKEEGVGRTVKAKSKVFLSIRLRAASWIDVSNVLVYKNGRMVKKIKVPATKEIERLSPSRKHEFDVSDGDAWFVVVAQGSKSMWPVVRSEEISPFQIGEALSLVQNTLLGGLGPFAASLSLGQDSCLLPTLIRTTLPLSLIHI